MSFPFAVIGARIFDGECWHDDAALKVVSATSTEIVPAADVRGDIRRIALQGGILAPGFVDLQVNGGGGVMFNSDRSVDGIRAICAAHARFGTTALLPTLITDTPEITAEAVQAGIAAQVAQVPGFLGLHLEGPHLSIARKGAHDPTLIRPMSEVDLEALIEARRHLSVLLSTVAIESVTPQQVSKMSSAGLLVSLGHTDGTSAAAHAYADAGARMVTHLFNAMSQMGNRAPGIVGAVLNDGRLSAGLIADGFHVAPETMDIALRAKQGPGRIVLVTDAMCTIGTDLTSFTLNGRTIRREGGKLTLDGDGSLAGADLDMISAVRFVHRNNGVPLEEVLRMASTYPAELAGVGESHGHLGDGARADFIHLSDDLDLRQVWVGGETVLPN